MGRPICKNKLTWPCNVWQHFPYITIAGISFTDATSGSYYSCSQDPSAVCSQPSGVSNPDTCFALATKTLPTIPRYLISSSNFENNP